MTGSAGYVWRAATELRGAAKWGVLALCLLGGVATGTSWSAEPARLPAFDVVIAGGSTAAVAAAFSAAAEGSRVALIEPTDWIGGQITSSGVPAIDEAWHKVARPGGGELNVARIARDPRNMTPWFRDALLATGNPGGGWVSRFCFEPLDFLERFLLPQERELGGALTVFREAVIKQVETDGRQITELLVIQRTPRPGLAAGGYDRLPSQDLADWYAPDDSPRFTKQVLRLRGTIFVDATEWGEVLALARAPMLQGVDQEDGTFASRDTCGQTITFGFVQKMHAEAVTDHPPIEPVDHLGLGMYRNRANAWQLIWTYRRLRGTSEEAAPGDLSLQNWGYSLKLDEGGNDYPFGYLFLPRQATEAQRANWRGGVDLQVMAAAEQRALAWHDWFRQAAPAGIDPDQITLAGEVLGTGHGLSKLPYIRDTRRSIGLDGFLLRFDDLIAADNPLQKTGRVFADRIALGAYPSDIHGMAGCQYVAGVLENHPTLPFYIPLRALTNDGYDNLMVAGKTMAQTFLANSATRLHPIEWSSGTACGVIAADLARSGGTTRQACDEHQRLQAKVAGYTPIDWVVEDGE